MPVRIIFRGLILFDVQNEGEEDGTITAYLIDGSNALPAMGAMHGASGADHGAMHKHTAEIQIFTGQSNNTEAKRLVPRGRLDLRATGAGCASLGNNDAVRRDSSYVAHCPSLPQIAESANLGGMLSSPDPAFVSHTVTINRGTIRVRDLVSWDAGAPELPHSLPSGTHLPARVKFLGADIAGYMASEAVIDVLNADEVHIGGSDDRLNTPADRPVTGVSEANLRVPPNTAEILITNFAPQRRFALPWTFHYGWMFQAAGYMPVPLPGEELKIFDEIVNRYSGGLSDDRHMFLGSDAKTGFPFPYFNPETALVSLNAFATPAYGAVALQDPWDREMCPLGDITLPGR